MFSIHNYENIRYFIIYLLEYFNQRKPYLREKKNSLDFKLDKLKIQVVSLSLLIQKNILFNNQALFIRLLNLIF